MKKMMILIGLLALAVLVVGCTQGTLAGEASGRSILTETRCDGRDDNRNRQIDEGCDNDRDGYCDVSMALSGTPPACPNGGGDCQDENSAFHPGATDECAPTFVDFNCDNVLSCAPTTSGTQCSGWTSYCDTLMVGESKDYSVGSTSYHMALTDILYQDYPGGVRRATFDVTIGGVTTGEPLYAILDENTYLSPGVALTITNILYQDYAGGVRSATFCLYP